MTCTTDSSKRSPLPCGTDRPHGAAADFGHEPVMVAEMLEILRPGPGKVVVDGTVGGGGHAGWLLAAGAEVIGLDRDPDACAAAGRRLADRGGHCRIVEGNFADLGRVLDRLGVEKIDGGLLDLGVSSWQLDEAGRGFSFLREGPLDMRMSPRTPVTAADLVNKASGEQLARIFRTFGEERGARRVAGEILARRLRREIRTTTELARLVEKVLPRRGRLHPATKVFQALRMAVNRELEALEEALAAFADRLVAGGRLAVISFHSLEDRTVKEFFRARSEEWIDRPEWPAPRPNPARVFRPVTRRVLVAGPEEVRRNPRSRSAKLRGVERI